jgi:hypothetical protein
VSSWRQSWRAHRDQVETVVVSLALGFGLAVLGLLAAIGWVSGRLRR